MSRFAEYEDEDYPNQWAMWEGRVKMALEGKRGRAALAELREALEALPEHRLIESALCRPIVEAEKVVGGEVCVIGAYLWYQKVKAGMDPVEAFAALPTLDVRDNEFDYGEAGVQTARLGRDAGLTWTMAYELAQTNDDAWEGATPEERWAKFIAWIDEELAKPPLTRPAKKPKRPRGSRARIAQPAKVAPLTVSMGL